MRRERDGHSLNPTALVAQAFLRLADQQPLPAKGVRLVGFAYGLGSLSGDKSAGKLGLIAGGEMIAQKEFTLTAYVRSPVSSTLPLPRDAMAKPKRTTPQTMVAPREKATRLLSEAWGRIRE